MSQNLAKDLWDARVSGEVLDPGDVTLPEDAAGAYALQQAITAVAGSPLAGFKIGATAQPTLDLMGLSEPFFGPLYKQFYEMSGSQVAISTAQKAGLETEFSVCLSCDLPSRNNAYTLADIEAAIDWVAPGFEIIGFRVAGEVAGAGLRLIGDGGANMSFIQGEPVRDWRRFDFSSHPVTLSVNGETAAEGHSGMSIFENAIVPVVWLANHSANARGLKAGDVITTGTVTGITPLQVGMHASADFGELGQVSGEFVAR